MLNPTHIFWIVHGVKSERGLLHEIWFSFYKIITSFFVCVCLYSQWHNVFSLWCWNMKRQPMFQKDKIFKIFFFLFSNESPEFLLSCLKIFSIWTSKVLFVFIMNVLFQTMQTTSRWYCGQVSSFIGLWCWISDLGYILHTHQSHFLDK